MSIKTKRYVIPTVNGTDELFQLPEDYIDTTLWAFVVQPNSQVTLRVTEFFTGGFFKISPAPVAGASIYCIYDITITDPNDPDNFDLDGVNLCDITKIIKVLCTQQEALKKMDLAVKNRLPISEFSKYSEALDHRLRTLELLRTC